MEEEIKPFAYVALLDEYDGMHFQGCAATLRGVLCGEGTAFLSHQCITDIKCYVAGCFYGINVPKKVWSDGYGRQKDIGEIPEHYYPSEAELMKAHYRRPVD
jgi:hypothetical protein